jgi:hypothetical protein
MQLERDAGRAPRDTRYAGAPVCGLFMRWHPPPLGRTCPDEHLARRRSAAYSQSRPGHSGKLPQGFLDYFVDGNTAVVEELCTALGAS